MKKLIFCFFIVLCLAGCAGDMAGLAEPVVLPANVTTTKPDANNNSYINQIGFFYDFNENFPFGKLTVCVAENVSNKDVVLKDAANSFVGISGNYYNIEKSQVVSSEDVFKVVDKETSTLVASGTTSSLSNVGMITIKDFIKYDLKASYKEKSVALKFFNITRAQESTGSLSNDGFSPVGTWGGARPLEVYNSIEAVSQNIKACLEE